MAEKQVGKVIHYYNKIGVAVVELASALNKGDRIKIGKGENVFHQNVRSMQRNKLAIERARKGQEVGLRVYSPVKSGYHVWKVKK